MVPVTPTSGERAAASAATTVTAVTVTAGVAAATTVAVVASPGAGIMAAAASVGGSSTGAGLSASTGAGTVSTVSASSVASTGEQELASGVGGSRRCNMAEHYSVAFATGQVLAGRGGGTWEGATVHPSFVQPLLNSLSCVLLHFAAAAGTILHLQQVRACSTSVKVIDKY